MGSITFPRTVLNRPYTYLRIEILMDEDWADSFALAEGERPLDITGMRVELWCRPAFGHPTLIKKLTSDPSLDKTIYIDDALKGAVSIEMSQADVAAAFSPGRWTHFLRLHQDYSAVSPVREIFRGDLIVHPGRV
jgi:hypothetical protein